MDSTHLSYYTLIHLLLSFTALVFLYYISIKDFRLLYPLYPYFIFIFVVLYTNHGYHYLIATISGSYSLRSSSDCYLVLPIIIVTLITIFECSMHIKRGNRLLLNYFIIIQQIHKDVMNAVTNRWPSLGPSTTLEVWAVEVDKRTLLAFGMLDTDSSAKNFKDTMNDMKTL